jgi:dodecin
MRSIRFSSRYDQRSLAAAAAKRNDPAVRPLRKGQATGGNQVSDNVYKIVEVVGSSTVGIEDAIEKAISRASSTLRDIRWFEVKETRGHVEDGRVAHYQVTLRIGFTLAD